MQSLHLSSFPTRSSSYLKFPLQGARIEGLKRPGLELAQSRGKDFRSEEHTSELQSLRHLVCPLLFEKAKNVFVRPESRLSLCFTGAISRCNRLFHHPFPIRTCFFLNDLAPTAVNTVPPESSLRA